MGKKRRRLTRKDKIAASKAAMVESMRDAAAEARADQKEIDRLANLKVESMQNDENI